MNPIRKIYITRFMIVSFVMIHAFLMAAPDRDTRDYLAPVKAIHQKIRENLKHPVQKLDIDLIMEGRDFSGSMPYYIRWDSDGSRFWFQWKRWNERENGTFEYVPATGKLRRLNPNEAEKVPSPSAVWDPQHRRAMWTVRDTVWLYDGLKKQSVRLISGFDSAPPDFRNTSPGSGEMVFYSAEDPFHYVGSGGVEPVTFSGDGSTAVLFFRNNLLAVSTDRQGGMGQAGIRQLTRIVAGPAPEEKPVTPGQRWLKDEQLLLFDVLKRRHEKRDPHSSPTPFYLDNWNIRALLPSPDLTHCAALLHRVPTGARRTMVPNYNAPSGYTENIPSYFKTPDETMEFKLVIIDLGSGRVFQPVLGEPGDNPRHIEPYFLKWDPEGKRALVAFGSADKKDARLGLLERNHFTADKIPVRVIAHDHDDAWVNGLVMRHFGWMPDGRGAWFVSERSGWMHLYSVSFPGGRIRALTKGDFLVLRPRLTPDHKGLIFSASVPGPFEMQTYTIPLTGGKLRPLTGGMGRAEGFPDPGGKWLAVVASGSAKPWELYIKKINDPGMGKPVTDSPSPAFKSYRWIEPEIVHFPSADGTPIPARLYKPVVPHPKRPAVIFAHGAGWLHNVHRWWSNYSREYCFHNVLTEHGYTVLDIDFRGSAGYGRNWRTAVYQKMPAGDMDDVVAGSRYLVEKHGGSPDRVGIYGGSAGGVVTLMALFTRGEHFGAGAALRSVPDIAYTDPDLPRRFLGNPVREPGVYRRASPIYYAEGLSDPLLLCHGVVDTNTHFQDVLRLAQRLIELRKTNWELAVYPMENHGFVEPSSWADEYRRIFKLFEENLKK